jgi:hypothetical protein
MRALAVRAFFMLILFHIYLARGSFSALQDKVRRFPISHGTRSQFAIDDVCRDIDLACIWYPKEVLCLQRSAALACLLKRYGFSAQLVVGARLMPFKAHAWVEVNGRVINDKPYIPEMYAVLDRC